MLILCLGGGGVGSCNQEIVRKFKLFFTIVSLNFLTKLVLQFGHFAPKLLAHFFHMVSSESEPFGNKNS